MKIDRERSYAYGRQELDAKLMDAAKPIATGAGVKKGPNCGREAEANEKFCPECGAKL